MGDLIEKFRTALLSKQRINLHKPFFRDEALKTLIVPLVNDYGDLFIPFRNKKCLFPTCLYDLTQLLEKFQQGGNQESFEFTCQICETPINLNNFLHDITLASELEAMWDKYNAGGSAKVPEVKQFKDGHCEGPLVSLVQQQVLQQQDDVLDSRDITPTSFLGKDKSIDKTVEKPIFEPQYIRDSETGDQLLVNFPQIKEYDKDDFSDLFYNFSMGKTTKTSKKAQSFGVEVLKQDLDSVMNDLKTHKSIIAFFARYVRNVLRITHPTKFDQIFAFEVSGFEKFTQKATYTFLQAFENPFKKNPQRLLDEKDFKIYLIFKHDQRWFVSLADMKPKKCIIADFLSPEFRKTSKDEVQNIIKAFLLAEFKIKMDNYAYYEQVKVNQINDCGLYACRYLANCIVNRMDPLQQVISESQKNLFKSTIPWLILKTNTLVFSLNQSSIGRETPSGDVPEGMDSVKKVRGLGVISANKKKMSPSHSRVISSVALIDKVGNSRKERATLKSRKNTQRSSINDLSAELRESPTPVSNKKSSQGRRDSSLIKLENNEGDRVSDRTSGRKRTHLSNISLSTATSPTKSDPSNVQLHVILQKAEELYQLKEQVEKSFQEEAIGELLSPKIYHRKFSDYTQKASDFQNLLKYFEKSNPDLYKKISSRITAKLEDKLFNKLKMLNAKMPLYSLSPEPLSSSASDATKDKISMYAKKLPPLAQSRTASASNSLEKRPPEKKKFTDLRIPSLAARNTRERIAKRYGVEIYYDELDKFKEDGTIPKDMVTFFFGYLQERHDLKPKHELFTSKQRILSLGPQFYDKLTNSKPMETNIYFKNVKLLTSQYQGVGNVIFDVFDKLFIVAQVEADHYMVVYIDTVDKKMVLYNPTNNKEQSPVNHPVLYNICQFMEEEYHHKAKQAVSMAKWRFTYGEMQKVSEIQESGLLIMRLVYSHYMKAQNGKAGKEDLSEFRKKLVGLAQAIGITQNKKNELGSFVKFPL